MAQQQTKRRGEPGRARQRPTAAGVRVEPGRDAPAGPPETASRAPAGAGGEAATGLDRLQERIGYRFARSERLIQALTHRSWRGPAAGAAGSASADNERMEFLGDAVLGLRASERLLERYPEGSEGELSGMRAWLVSARHLAQVADRLQLGACLRLSRAEEALGGRHKQRLLANALEALIAALYLDGGYAAAAAMIDRQIVDADETELAPAQLHAFAYKSALQEWAHAHARPLPVYRVLSAVGPEHGKIFTVSVEIADGITASAAAHSKKEAQQLAARDALDRLGLLQAGRTPAAKRN